MTIQDMTTTVVATSAVASSWVNNLEDILSEHAIAWVPILGVVWLAVQITLKLYNFFRSIYAKKGNTSDDP